MYTAGTGGENLGWNRAGWQSRWMDTGYTTDTGWEHSGWRSLGCLRGAGVGVGAEESKGQFQYQIPKIPVSTTRHHRVRTFRVDLVGGGPLQARFPIYPWRRVVCFVLFLYLWDPLNWDATLVSLESSWGGEVHWLGFISWCLNLRCISFLNILHYFFNEN